MENMTTANPFDISIIGGGPIGLYAASLAGEKGAKCNLIDSRLQLGGLMRSVYPNRIVHDFADFPPMTGRELSDILISKTDEYGHSISLGQYVQFLSLVDNDIIKIETNRGEIYSRAVIIASGLKAYCPSILDYIKIDNWDGRGIQEHWDDNNKFENKSIAVIYDSLAFAQSIIAQQGDKNRYYFIINAENDLMADDGGEMCQLGNHEVYKHPWTIKAVTGNRKPEAIILIDEITQKEKSIKIDLIFECSTKHARQTLFSLWGINTFGLGIVVDQRMMTNINKVYAVGDIAIYPGKIKLLSNGVDEAQKAVKSALKILKINNKTN